MKIASKNSKLTAALQAVLVTILWSSSWVLIKIGLTDIPPLIFAGIRYTMGAVILLVFYIASPQKVNPKKISRSTWGLIIAYGIIYFAAGQGTTFISLNYLSAVTTNLILSNIPIVVALMSIFITREPPSFFQWLGIALCFIGILAYFFPASFQVGQVPGLIAAGIGILVNSVASILGRYLNREGKYPALWITLVSLSIGGPILLISGLVTESFPVISMKNWMIILWLAFANTAIAFTLLNHTLKTLTAVESSMINTLMTVEIPILAIIFLGETITLKGILGLVMVTVGILMVQAFANRRKRPETELT